MVVDIDTEFGLILVLADKPFWQRVHNLSPPESMALVVHHALLVDQRRAIHLPRVTQCVQNKEVLEEPSYRFLYAYRFYVFIGCVNLLEEPV